jgi:hypothetical protein
MPEVTLAITQAIDSDGRWTQPHIGLKAHSGSIMMSLRDKTGSFINMDLSGTQGQLLVESLKVLLKHMDRR